MDRGRLLKRKPCPKQNAGFLSLLTFSYLLKFIYKGRQKEIEEVDLYDVMDTFQSKKLADRLERHWYRHKAKRKNPSIIKPLISCYGKTLLMLGIAQSIAKVIHLYTVPWALSKFISYFDKSQNEVTRDMAFFYAGLMMLASFLKGVWEQHFSLWKLELGIKMQAAISSLLYRKALTLNQSKISEISTGRIVTSIVKDVSSLNSAILYGVDFVLETFQVILVCYLLYDKVGIGSVGGLSIMGISLFLQIAVSRITYFKRGGCNKCSDQRLQQTQEVLSSVRLIKMYRWESFFKDRLTKIRKIELSNLQSVFVWKSISIIVGVISGRIAQASVYLIYMQLGYSLNADIIYYIQQLFQKVSTSMIFIPIGIQSVAEFLMCVQRIDAILNAEENTTIYKSTIQMLKPEINLAGVDVKFGKWTVLKNIDLKLKSGLHILLGPSGCGKSSLLKAILEEYDATAGTLKVQGTISYANQNPWLFPSSLKQNILFGQTYDEKKYRKVIEMCGLTYDLNNFMNGDETVLTDCGANLSRGQQSRINLARAIYRDSDIYLLDDSLASLDIHIKNQVFNNAIKNYLKNKLCILVTHSTQFVNQADNVIIMAENSIKYTGKPADIPPELFQQIEEHQNDDVDETTEENMDKDSIRENMVTDESSALLSKPKNFEKENIYSEKKKAGRVNFNVYKNYFKYGGGLLMIISLFGFHIICELSTGAGEKFMSAWVNQQASNTTNISNNNNPLETTTLANILDGMNSSFFREELNNTMRRTTRNFEDIFDETSTEKLELNSKPFVVDMFTLYIIALVLSSVFVVIRCFLTYYYTIKVSKNMHKSMVANILHGSMPFFDTHLIGNILTRFSKDLFIMDEVIPFIWLEGFRIFFLLPICLMLIATVSPILAAVSVFLSIMFCYLCGYIMSTTRSTQRLSNSTLSPVIGHLNASLEGLMIIRAYGTQQILKDEFDKHQDMYISANHLREIAARVLGFYSHSLASIFTSSITLWFLFVAKDALAGDVGLVLSQSTLMSMLLEFAIIMWMVMENSMTSVERALEYTRLPQENQMGRDLEKWPNEGRIKFQNVSLTYRTNGEAILKNLNFTIHPQEKIGIVGRTGAGKSSIIVTLFKMYDFSGDIMIDNVNIKTLSLECLRTHLAIIPQDPVIFTGTLRTNIDPKQSINDEQVWKILEVINLKSCFMSLDEDITQKNLSIGQKQLICLARALTRRSKIVILDEATANMDEEMDLFIQSKIRELFQFCTVITVAHRLHTVRNCDRIIVMDKGEIVEFDTPHNLLSDTNGMFHKMVHQKTAKSSESRNKKIV